MASLNLIEEHRIIRGDPWVRDVPLSEDGETPLDLTGKVLRSQIRRTPDATVVEATFTITSLGVNAEGTHTVARFQLTAAETAVMTPTIIPGTSSGTARHVVDVELADATTGDVERTLVSGVVDVQADVTRV